MSVRAALDEALRAEPRADQDAAAVAAARLYADLIDNAAPRRAYQRAWETIEASIYPVPEEAEEALNVIRTALAQHSVASDLGPKLLAALDALLLSPRARAAAQKGMKQSGKPGASRLDELRERRARKHGSPTGDAATP